MAEPAPPTYSCRGGVHYLGFPDGTSLEIRQPRQDRFGRLIARVIARADRDHLLNDARLDLLDQRARLEFHSVAAARNGDIDWHDRLLVGLTQVEAAPAGDGGERGAGAETPAEEDGPPWPAPLEAEAYHGPIGKVVRAVEPSCEADPAALLLHTLVGIGALVGSQVHALAGDAIHPPRLFGAVVGETAKGRKDSAARPVGRLLRLADEPFAAGRILEGLSSGEGLIWAVRDPIRRYERTGRGKTATQELVEVDPGVGDKRLLIVESELASTLRVIQRRGTRSVP